MRRSQAMLVKRLMILLPVLNEAEGLDIVLRTIPSESLIELGWEPNIVIVDGKVLTIPNKLLSMQAVRSLSSRVEEKEKPFGLVSITQSRIILMQSSCSMQI